VEDLPLAPLALGAAALLVGPVRRRVMPVARATGVAALGLVGAATGGIGGIVDAAVRGDRADRTDRPGRSK
jgi:hypothetical protein